MLGNFSFGDYFKEEAIAFAWEYITKTLELEPKHLYATVFTEDDEAERLWKKIAPELGDRVLRFGEKDNYWSMGDTGPCGPCSEIHFDRGNHFPGELNGEGDRFMEIWNLVFMQYNRDESGKLTPLPKPSVDTGAGLERFCMILQDGNSNYETDLFLPLIEKVAEISGRQYSIDDKGVSHRVIADHLRALTFAIADGGIISNEGRGYVLRRILRRAARHGRLLDLHEPFLHKLVETLTEIMGDQYPEIRSKRKHIELVLQSEEEQFGRTLDTGLEIFEDIIKKVESSGSKIIPGVDVFRLYDTFGFPPDLTEVMAAERGLHVDFAGFQEELGRQRERSKDFRIAKTSLSELIEYIEYITGSKTAAFADDFVGYDHAVIKTTLTTFQPIDPGDLVAVALATTPFYSESGGQVSDKGSIYCDHFNFDVGEVLKDKAGNIYHIGRLASGNVPGARPLFVTAEVDHARRADIKRNHTATHLLHKALREVLGDHVHQSGSFVAPDRLRFDFTHFKAMTDDEIRMAEKIVREKIEADLPVKWEYKSLDEAKAMGAMALFGEKYGDTVRVVKTGDYSMELCGGTHVDHTADIGEFYITQEAAIAAGMRRIEALTGRGANDYREFQEGIISELSGFMKKGAGRLSEAEASRFSDLLSKANNRFLRQRGLLESYAEFSDSVKISQKEKEKEKASRLLSDSSGIEPKAVIGDQRIFVYVVPASNAGEVMVFSDKYKSAHGHSSVVTISERTGNFAITPGPNGIGEDIMKTISSLSGVRGGGKPTARGSMPVGSIAEVIRLLVENFGK